MPASMKRIQPRNIARSGLEITWAAASRCCGSWPQRDASPRRPARVAISAPMTASRLGAGWGGTRSKPVWHLQRARRPLSGDSSACAGSHPLSLATGALAGTAIPLPRPLRTDDLAFVRESLAPIHPKRPIGSRVGTPC